MPTKMPSPMSDEDLRVMELATLALDPSKQVHLDPYDLLALIARAKLSPAQQSAVVQYCYTCVCQRTFNRFGGGGGFSCVVCGCRAP